MKQMIQIDHNKLKNPSLRADEIKLWLTPSAKQRHFLVLNFQLKKAFVSFVVIAKKREIRKALSVIHWGSYSLWDGK